MTYAETLEWMHTMPRTHTAPTLSRMERLLAMLGNPENALRGRFLHVTGTNGKGSVCAFLSMVLRREGYSVGRFISPFIMQFRERMEIDGVMISEEEVAALGGEIRACVERFTRESGETPLEFELVTLMGFLWFARRNCDLVVLEVGIGGLYDATNVVTPLASVIMRVDYDHTELLGETLSEIARHKAGIIKPGAPCILYADNAPEVYNVIQEACSAVGSPLIVPDQAAVRIGEAVPGQLSFVYRYTYVTLSLSGLYQVQNAVTAIEVLCALPALGYPVSEDAIAKGLAETTFPARFEVLCSDPPVILDGAHNASGIHAMAENIAFYFADKPLLYLVGMLRDKHPAEALREVLFPSRIRYAACITPPSPRAMPAKELAAALEKEGVCAEAYPSVRAAMEALRAMQTEAHRAGEDIPVLCFGSLYSAGDVRRTLCNDKQS